MKKKYLYIMIVFMVFTVLVNGFLIYQACLPADSSSEWSNVVVNVYKEITGTPPGDNSGPIPGVGIGDFVRKVFGHFLLFSFDGIITYIAFHYLFLYKEYKSVVTKVMIVFSIGLVMAIITEIIQYYIPSRSGEVVDSLIDIGGFVFGGGIIYLIYFLIEKRQSKKEITENNI